ncbi:hypothetical protein ERJ75_000035800 [Trypanosoma vivax]|uniref:Rab-GAP TBC domain-containing protein n=1 Tax=Trypanosoma vivax (strain Y486) TaxID=1055687 RepID=G0U7U6_TRYVY|nr:hypothetical protein TRVL_00416 [Trypanosoma vivax]KAH8620394.1 hypothetical protein ERJ75_000035800 [Trypanosoma vivax]CCC51954.1 conserved hypothetical protein [Trypanosoma vivax Y486]
MSVAISACTLCTALWPSGAKATASSGRILQVTLADKTARRFVHASFDPQDETVFYAATDKSEIYAFCMSRNVVKLFAALEYPVTSFDCVSGVGRPLLLCATEDGSLTWMDCTTSRILSRSKTPHRMAIHAIGTMGGCGTSKLAFTLSSDTLTVWDVVRMAPRANSCRSEMHAVGSFIAAHMGEKTIVTVESSGCVTAWEVPTLLQVRSVVAVSVRLRASSVCQKYVAVGGSNALVGLIRTDDFTSMGALTLSKDHAAVRSLTFVHDEMLVCELTNGIVVFVVLETFTIAFAMEVPFTLTLPKKLSIFALSGPSFAVFAHGDKLTVFHLPTARQCYLQLRRIDIAKNNPASPTVAHSFVQKVGDGRGGAKGATQKRDGEVVGGKKDDEGAERRQFTLRPNATQVAKWVKVNLVTKQRGISGDTADTYPEVAEQGSLCPESQKRSNNAARSQNDDNNGGEEIHLRKFLDEASLSANMKCLKRLLLRYGTFPDKYRPVTWRFLSKLPEKRFTAPQYAQLLSKGTHPSASSLIKPFPLDNKQTQESMEKVLSILAWHLPMFAVIHFLPLIVYPFLRVLKNDLQTTVELVLVFLSNWGQEFFQFYPHHPVALTTLLDELLRREDEQLHGYLERCGIMVETWGWLPLRSVYTDILTQAEWMQVMDHALFNEPLWLFLFHVRWMVSVRGEFFKQQGQQELTEFCLSVHDVDVNSVIAEAYRLQERCVRGELTKCYEYLRPFVNHAYPVAWECAEENIATMLKDMQLSLSHELRNRESRQRIKALSETLAEADVLKEVYAKGKQARVAAELSVKTEKWKGEVARKKEENEVRTMENMMRLQRMKRDVEHRMSLESLSADLISTRAQLAHLDDEGEREILNWKRAENLTNRELVRLESATRDRLAMAIKGIEKDEQCNTQCSATVSGSATNSASNKDTCTHLAAAADEATSFVTPLVEGHRSGLQSGDPLEVYRSLQNSAKQETGRSVASKLDTPPALHNCISGASLHHSAGTGVRQDDAFARAAALPTTNFPVASAASANTNKSRYRDTKNLLYDNLLDTSLTSTGKGAVGRKGVRGKGEPLATWHLR